MRSPARSTRRRAAPSAAARFQQNGSCRISAIDLPATRRESQAVAKGVTLTIVSQGQLMVLSACQSRFARRAYRVALSVLATAVWCIAGIAPGAAQDAAPFYRGKTVRIVVGFS